MDWLMYFSLSPPDMLAGFLGGIVNCFIFRRAGPKAWCGALIVGTLTAKYLAVPVNNLLYTIHPHGGAFLVGAGGVAFITWFMQIKFSKPQSEIGLSDWVNHVHKTLEEKSGKSPKQGKR
jgi:hypothetical protein